jgi:hypothetical protein
MLTKVSYGLLGAAVTIVGTPTAVYAAAPEAPKSFTAARAASDMKKINLAWKAVPGADHYVIETVAGNVESVVNVPASSLSYTVDASDICTSYKIRVGAADAAGNTTSTTYWTLKSLAPTYISGVTNGREDDGTTIWESWKAPASAGESPLTGYHVVFSRVSDGGVMADEVVTDTTYRYKGVDPARAYNVSVTTMNAYGECSPAKSTVDRYRPADVTNLTVERRADAPGTVEVLWKPAAGGLTPDYYLVSYGQDKMIKSVRIDAPATRATLSLDIAKPWTIEVKAYNANGGSNAVTGSVPVWTPAPVTPPTSEPAPVDPSATPGEPGGDSSTTSTTVNTGSDRTPPTISTSLSTTPKNGWFRSAVTIHFTCSDSGSAIATCPADLVVDKDGYASKYSGTAVDNAGNTTTITQPLSIDQTPPTVTAKVTGDKNADGWYTSAPTVHYTCTDTVSGYNTLNVCPTDITVTADGASQKITGTAWDKAGNTAPESVIVSLDRTAPVIKATVIGATPNADGWYTAAPTVHFTCSDPTSGIVSCPADIKVTKDGLGQEFTGSTSDKAGNSSTATATINLDRQIPGFVAKIIGDANAEGWYRTAPTLHIDCFDSVSGIASCSPDQKFQGEGTGRELTITAIDKAGNLSDAATFADVDGTAPSITASVIGDANADGWYGAAPTVHFTCADETSGIATCPADIVVTKDGAQTLTGVAVDVAGNSAEASVTLNVDTGAPQVKAAIVGDANADGWYNTAPTVHFTCTDAVSGVATCPADAKVALDGTQKVVMGTAFDKAGNSGTTSITLNLDQTAPAILATLVEQANATGWYRTAPTVHFTCTDTGSGIATCPADAKVTTNGAGQKVTGTAVDKAGNTATATATVNVDLLAPEVTPTVEGTKNAAGWYRTTPTVRYDCKDTVSAVATCPVAKTVTAEGTDVSVAGTASDNAGNTTASTLRLNIDKTAPVASVLGVTNGATYDADKEPTVSCGTTDQGSGVATNATVTSDTADSGVHTVVCSGGVDKAGNTAAPVSVSYTVKATNAWLLNLTRQYLGTAGASAMKDFEAALAKDNYSNYRAKVTAYSNGKNPLLSPDEAVTLTFWSYLLDLKH